MRGLTSVDGWPGPHHHASSIMPPSSFIRRCLFADRGCGESSSCSDLRTLFDARKEVDEIPPPDQCGRVKYISSGSDLAYRHGVMDDDRKETTVYPGEEWHKCCVLKGSNPRLMCEKAEVVPRLRLVRKRGGFCGLHKCVGNHDRCLIVDQKEEKGLKPKKGEEGVCPKSCKEGPCNRVTKKLECIYLGDEPKYGHEGSETPKGAYNEPEAYEVYALSMPAPLFPVGFVTPEVELLRRQQLYRSFLG
eukprot:gnl/TRDRNA2_/TRDRNA2_193641_c0_seq1.p1 gnl/TRDRNA2_/TRDRNA2_193641_c0~~gnl/TRDRNA2_/TRDRNA2_193641_c0_seq1.p1  ORF type:complete len:247 (+),score=35.49 gnl/TRDRNA2_/TRDRNA2_193641_c0_seq1:112-852(+)